MCIYEKTNENAIKISRKYSDARDRKTTNEVETNSSYVI